MAQKPEQPAAARSDLDLALMAAQIATAVSADAVICGTSTGSLFRHMHEAAGERRVVAATPDKNTHDVLTRDGSDVVRLPIRVTDKHRQARHIIAMALSTGKVSVGDLVVCVVGHDLCRGSADLVLVTDIEASAVDVALSEVIKLTDGIRPQVLEAALEVACKIGRVARRGKGVGALIVLGDSTRVLEESKQLILNPFQGHPEKGRLLQDLAIHETLVELAKLDGAFVVRGDGYVQTAGLFLAVSRTDVEVSAGLGARHVAAAAVTARTQATAVAVSSTDGQVRVFSGGELVLQMDPEVPFGPITRRL